MKDGKNFLFITIEHPTHQSLLAGGEDDMGKFSRLQKRHGDLLSDVLVWRHVNGVVLNEASNHAVHLNT